MCVYKLYDAALAAGFLVVIVCMCVLMYSRPRVIAHMSCAGMAHFKFVAKKYEM